MCIDDANLRRLLEGKLLGVDLEQCEQHLSDCPQCRQRLDAQAGGHEPWTGQASFSTLGDSPRLGSLMEHLKSESRREDLPSVSSLKLKLRQLGDYEILEELGRGGMGVVYRARQRSLRREVALKVILGGQLASPAEIRRFQVEAEAAAKLDHPNIVQIFDTGEHDGHHFFSMKLINGRSLADALTQGQFPSHTPAGARDWKHAARIVATIARAVHYAHQRGVLHRDLKPHNIILDDQGHPYVTDFGLAKLVEHDSRLTHSVAIMGSPNYISPEVAGGHARDATTAADVYSLGAVLFEILAGCPPFKAESPAQTLQLVLGTEPALPSSAESPIPADLATICLQCLEKVPSRRPASAEQLAEELDRFYRGEPIRSRPITRPERVWRWCRRKPALAATLAALVLVFLAGFLGILWKWNAEVHQRQLAQQESARASQAVTHLEIGRAESMFQLGNTSEALALLARLLREQPTNAILARRLLNALSFRNFSLPIASLSSLSANRPKTLSQDYPDSPFSSHAAMVAPAQFSPDGTRVVTADKDGTVHLWDARTGQSLTSLAQHNGPVTWAQFSTDVNRIVTASADGTARVWNLAPGASQIQPLRHEAPVYYASFAPGNLRVVTASADRTARIWNIATGELLATIRHEAPVFFASFSPDAKKILTASIDGDVSLWDVATRQQLSRFQQDFRTELAWPFPHFVNGGARVLLVNRFNLELWSVSSQGGPPIRLHHQEPVTALAASADGSLVASGTQDAAVLIYDSSGKLIGSPLRHGNAVLTVQFRQDRTQLVTGSRDRKAYLWDVRSGYPICEPLWHDGPVSSAAVAPKQPRLLTASGDACWLWTVRPPAFVPVTIMPEAGLADLAHFNRDGRQVLTVTRPLPGTRGGAIQLWDSDSGDYLLEIRHPQPQPIINASFSPDSRYIASVTSTGNARRWNATNGLPAGPPLSGRAVLNGPQAPIRLVAFSPDGQRLATGSADGAVFLWDPASGELLRQVYHDRAVTAAEFSPDNHRMLTASEDGTAFLWNLKTGAIHKLFHDHPVSWAQFDRTGERVATASRAVRIWSAATGKPIGPPLLHAVPLADEYCLDFSPDGSSLATAAGETLQLWSIQTGKPATPPLNHPSRIRSVRFSPRGDCMVTACDDGSARIWDSTTGHLLCDPLRHEAPVTYAEFDAQGLRLLTVSSGGMVRIWPILLPSGTAPAWLPELAEALAGQRIDAEGAVRPRSAAALLALVQSLSSSSAKDFYSRWARWWLADRPPDLSPSEFPPAP